MNKLLPIATISSAMFLAGCNATGHTQVQTFLSAPGEPLVLVPYWTNVCKTPNNKFRSLRDVEVIKPIDNPKCLGRKLHAGEQQDKPWHRYELKTKPFSIIRKETHVFEADVAFTGELTTGTEWIIIKQLHSNAPGHAASVQISPSKIRIDGQFKECETCAGVHGRVTDKPAPKFQTNHKHRNDPSAYFPWRFDGTQYHFKVVNEFDGTGGFWTHVDIDGKRIVSGYANYPQGEGYEKFMKPEIVFHKFGIYGPTFPVKGEFRDVSMEYIVPL